MGAGRCRCGSCRFASFVTQPYWRAACHPRGGAPGRRHGVSPPALAGLAPARRETLDARPSPSRARPDPGLRGLPPPRRVGTSAQRRRRAHVGCRTPPPPGGAAPAVPDRSGSGAAPTATWRRRAGPPQAWDQRYHGQPPIGGGWLPGNPHCHEPGWGAVTRRPDAISLPRCRQPGSKEPPDTQGVGIPQSPQPIALGRGMKVGPGWRGGTCRFVWTQVSSAGATPAEATSVAVHGRLRRWSTTHCGTHLRCRCLEVESTPTVPPPPLNDAPCGGPLFLGTCPCPSMCPFLIWMVG